MKGSRIKKDNSPKYSSLQFINIYWFFLLSEPNYSGICEMRSDESFA